MNSERYARIYWTVMDDPKFDGIREDVRLFGAWALCLVVADMSWPAPAFIPPMVPRSAFARLVEHRLVDELPGHRYRIHGMDPERERRSRNASAAAGARWRNADSNANGNAPGIAGRNAETMLAKQSRAEHEQSIALAAWEEASGRSLLSSGNAPFVYLDDAIRRHGDAKVADAIRRARPTFAHVPEVNALASAVRRILDPLPDGKAIASQEREAEIERASANRSLATLRLLHGQGAHTDPHPRCPLCNGGAAA